LLQGIKDEQYQNQEGKQRLEPRNAMNRNITKTFKTNAWCVKVIAGNVQHIIKSWTISKNLGHFSQTLENPNRSYVGNPHVTGNLFKRI
jgi:hypothetical protein